jgi:hypothetical protein
MKSKSKISKNKDLKNKVNTIPDYLASEVTLGLLDIQIQI